MTQREKLLLAIVPALLVGGIYGFFVSRPALAKISTAEKTANNLKSRLATADALPELLQINAQLDIETAELKKLKTRWDTFVEPSPSSNRPDRIERLNELLLNSGLVVADSVDADSGKPQNRVEIPANIAKSMTDLLGTQSGRVRQITVYGTYPQVLDALEKLAAGKLTVVPLRVTMKAINVRTNLREWTILLWV